MSEEFKSDIEIARDASMRPISEVASKIGVQPENILRYGPYKAKFSKEYIQSIEGKKDGKVILVTAITPTPAGEGKTTVTIGLGDGLNKIGKKTMICLREPSLGPCFGVKGGAAGGGYSQVVPMEDINLHFTGDFHAIGAANNLLAAAIDNHIYWGNELRIDLRRVEWRRVLDMNDRALRSINSSLGGITNGFPREDGFDITVASEVMAIFCLATSLEDFTRRLGDIVVARTRDKEMITARDLKMDGPMTVLMKEAFMPNLVQTLENNPAIIHGGPFANIAHGCNSVIATKTSQKLADYVVTEAGFGADLGAEKFFNIKCRKSGIVPSVVVLVATIRALKMQGGVAKSDLSTHNLEALQNGMCNIDRHIKNLKSFGIPVVVAINHFTADSEEEIDLLIEHCKKMKVKAILCTHWAEGSSGAVDLAREVARIADLEQQVLQFTYQDDIPLYNKVERIAKKLYGAKGISAEKKVMKQFQDLEDAGLGHLPVCIAKTQYSFTTEPKLIGAPEGHVVTVKKLRLSAGAGFVVVITGDIMTMPGLPRVPAANNIKLNENGDVVGLF